MPSLKNMPYPYYSPPPAPPPPPSPPPCNPPPPPPPCKEPIPPPPPPPPRSKHCHHKHCGHHHHHHPPNGASPPTPTSNPASPPVSPPSHHRPKSHAPTTPPQTPTHPPKVPPHGPVAPPKPTPGSPHCPPSPVPKPGGHKKPPKPKTPAYPPKTPSHPPKTPPVSPVAPPKMLPGSPYPRSPAPKPGGPVKPPKPSPPAYRPKTSSTPPTTLPGSPHYSPSSAPKPNGPSQPPKPFRPAYPPKKTPSGPALPPNTSPESPHYPPSFTPKPSRPVKPPKPSPPNTPPGGPRAPPPTSLGSPAYPPISNAVIPLSSNNSVSPPPSGSGGNHHTTVIAVCASLGGFFFLTFLAAGLFRLGKTKKLIRVPAVAKQAIGAFFGAEGDEAPDGGGGEISEDSKGKPFDLSTVRNHSFQRRFGDGDRGSPRQPLGRPPPTELAALSHRPASKGPSTSKVRSGLPAGKQAWEHMKDAMNPNDSGTPEGYTSDQLLDLGAGDPVSQEVDERWFDENGKSKEELAQRPSRRDFPKEKYNPDAKHRRRPPASAAGKNRTEKPRADVVSRFKDSDKFKNALMDAAADIYEQTVQECRRILQETGRVAEEDLLLIDPNLPMNFNAQGVIEDAGDVEDDNEDDISPLP